MILGMETATTTQPEATNLYRVNADGLIKVESRLLFVLDARIATMTKIAKRYQFPVPTYTTVGYEYSTNADNTKTEYAIVKISDVNLRFDGGWKFVAVVDHTAQGNIVRTNPTHADHNAVTMELATAEPTCDHCGKTRQRTKTIVVVNDEGDVKRIGGQCAKTFLGNHVTLSQAMMDYFIALDKLANMDDMDEFMGFGSTQVPRYEVLAVTSAVIRVYGYSKGGEFQIGTKDRVKAVLNPSALTKELREGVEVTLADYDTAEKTIAYLANLEATGLFDNNVKVAVANGDTKKSFGLIVWAVEMYLRTVREEAVAKAQANTPKVEATPVVTGRVTITGVVAKRYSRDTDWGTQFKMIVLDDRGFKVCGTEPSALYAEEGDRVTFTATVEASPTDNTFGFFKRPTKAEVLAQVA